MDPTQTIRILIADDEPEICRFISDLLRGPGREIVSATTVDEAIQTHEKTPCDIVISDINFNASATGLDLVRAVKSATPAAEVVLMSGFGTLDTAVEAVRAGAFDYVSKPFDIKGLLGAVERWARQAQRAA